MKHHNALILFSHTPQISRESMDEPFAALPWEDLDVLFTAFVGDVVTNSSQLVQTDIILYRNEDELSDDYFRPFRQRVRLENLDITPLSAQVQVAIERAFHDGYLHVVVLLENNPLLTSTFLIKVFNQLRYEDDCFIVGPTMEGRSFLVGMKMNHASVFNHVKGDPLMKPHVLLNRLCSFDNHLFLTNAEYSLDSAMNLARLKRKIQSLDRSSPNYPTRTAEVFKMFDKKYKWRKALR
ncbi:MAG: hypothetical protein HYR76_01815 [Ignavibacteria bacterium]|nr:hypothetical protein [Ignavibacteria bacterium]